MLLHLPKTVQKLVKGLFWKIFGFQRALQMQRRVLDKNLTVPSK